MKNSDRGWYHSPVHVFQPDTTYIVTAGTYHKQHFFKDAVHLSLLRDTLFNVCDYHGWVLLAWALFPNHYHIITQSPQSAHLTRLIQHLHSDTARNLNKIDHTPGRKVWFEYWDTCLTYERSYIARLNYVHNNPVKHGIAVVSENYSYCSAAWFKAHADPAFRKKVESFGIERVKIIDDF